MFFWNSLFFDDLKDPANLISGFSAFSKSSLNIWNFSIHVLLEPGLKNFEHYFTSIWDECNYAVVWTFSGIAFLWDWNENLSFPVLWPQLCFPNLVHIECSTFTASSFRIWNSSAEIPLSPLRLFVVKLPKAHWLHTPDVCLWVSDHSFVVIQVIKTFLI